MEENRDDFGEDIDIENLAAALDGSDGQDMPKDMPDADGSVGVGAAPSETPVFSEEPAPSPVPDESSAGAPAEGAPADPPAGEAGESKAEPAGDIDALIRKYEEIPSGKKEIVKTGKSGGGKALPVLPIAAGAGVVVLLAVLKFVVFKPAPAVQRVQPKTPPAKTAPAAPSSADASAGVDYPGGAVLLGETADGIEIKIIETAAAARDIKLFYQKNMTAQGFELAASRKNRSTFNMNFFKGKEDYSVSVVPHEEKNLIIVTRAK